MAWPFSVGRPRVTVAPLPMSRAIVVEPLAGSGGLTDAARHAGRRRDRPAAQHPDRFGLGPELLNRLAQVLLVGSALDVEEELVAAEPAPQRAGLDPGQVDLALREDLEGVHQGAGVILAELGEDQRGSPRPRPR